MPVLYTVFSLPVRVLTRKQAPVISSPRKQVIHEYADGGYGRVRVGRIHGYPLLGVDDHDKRGKSSVWLYRVTSCFSLMGSTLDDDRRCVWH